MVIFGWLNSSPSRVQQKFLETSRNRSKPSPSKWTQVAKTICSWSCWRFLPCFSIDKARPLQEPIWLNHQSLIWERDMDVLVFPQRLRRLLAGEEGTLLPDGAKEQIQNLQTEIQIMASFLLDNEAVLLKLFEDKKGIPRSSVKAIMKKMINIARESEKAIDTFIVNIKMQHKSEECISKELRDALHGLETNITDIKLEMQEVQASGIHNNFQVTSIHETQANDSTSTSGSIKRRERQLINKKHRMVGRKDQMEESLDLLIDGPPSLSVLLIKGEFGIGKTTLAAEAYNNIYVKNYFDVRAWSNVSHVSSPINVLEDILKCMMPSSELSEIMKKDDQQKKTTLCDYLRNKRYLIVLDDLCRISDIWDEVRATFPDDQNRSRILITYCPHHKVKMKDCFELAPLEGLSIEESKEMLVDRVFAKYPLEELESEKSVEILFKDMCGGNPLMVLLFVCLLIEKDKLDDMLSQLKRCPTTIKVGQIDFPVLTIFSYWILPLYLKPCFLYMALFHIGPEISTSQFYQLWIAEGFIHDNSETTTEEYLEELVDRGLIQVRRRTSRGRIKTCIVHFWLHVLLIVEAHKKQFIEPLMYEKETQLETCKRISTCIGGDPTELLSSEHSAPYLRSLLCLTSQGDHPNDPGECNYVSENFKLLWVLDLGALFFNQCPVGIEKLLLLRYLKLNILSLTAIPPSLCNLPFLYTLDLPSSHIDHVPDEFWKMENLRHLNVHFIKLPAHPGKFCSSLKNLNFISTLCPSSCTQDILGRLPNLQSLHVFGNLSPHQPMLSKSLSQLLCLKSLKLVNDSKVSKQIPIFLGEYQFPPRLVDLTLSNTELKDDPMPTLEKLRCLELLKLKHNSYSGRKLACSSLGFPQLKVLHLKSMLWLEEWTMETGVMPKLECLVINPCAYLRKLPEELWHIKTFCKLELWWPRPELKPKLRELEDMDRYDIEIYPSGI